jgi:nicotinate-nucleotide adenylyltransferase
MRVGLLGGSFDPVHFGHLRAAQWALGAMALDSVRLVPARQSPFKSGSVASGEDRLAMLTLAVEGNAALAVEDCELRRDPPSYTVDTLRALVAREPDVRFVWIVGSDAAKDICVLSRPGDAPGASPNHEPFEGFAVSSTDIREARRRGRSVRYLTPESVRLFIEEKGLYK